jgi:hypothetical protein
VVLESNGHSKDSVKVAVVKLHKDFSVDICVVPA